MKQVKAVANFAEVDEVRKALGLSAAATLIDYGILALRHQPDKHCCATGEESEGTMRRLNWAHKLLVDCYNNYKYSFREEDIARAYSHDDHIRRYYYGWFENI